MFKFFLTFWLKGVIEYSYILRWIKFCAVVDFAESNSAACICTAESESADDNTAESDSRDYTAESESAEDNTAESDSGEYTAESDSGDYTAESDKLLLEG